MNLHVINTGYFKLDGGAMFGVVPKSLWQRTNPPDEKNLCSWAMRCLLIEDLDLSILGHCAIEHCECRFQLRDPCGVYPELLLCSENCARLFKLKQCLAYGLIGEASAELLLDAALKLSGCRQAKSCK